MNKKKLAIVENSFALGGVQRLVLDQINQLDPEEFEIVLIVMHQLNQDTFYDLVPDRVRVEKLHFTGWLDFKTWWQLFSILRKYKPDVVKSSLFLSNTMVRILKPFVGYKVVTAEHNTNDGKGSLHQRLNRFLNRLSYTTIVDSKMVASHLSESESLPIDRYTVIYNGVNVTAVKEYIADHQNDRETFRAKLGIQPEDTVFFTVGRFVRQKNHVRMIQAFADFNKTHPASKLIIVGEGLLQKDMEAEVATHNLEEKVHIIPATTEIKQYYLMSDFTLLSSNHEGFCIAAMEGLAFGRPLVSTKVAGIEEYLIDGKNGFFAEKTPESLANSMRKVVDLEAGELTAFQTAAKATAEDYSIERYGEKFREVILGALASN